MDAVGKTALWVAAMRAEESKRADRLFEDPFAERLAGEVGYEGLRLWKSVNEVSVPIIEVRTRFFDERFADALESGLRQIVILASGMDARAYRLAWPEGARVFELDRPEVLAYKKAKLEGVSTMCERIAVAIDLATDWTSAIVASTFDANLPTLWLAEGLTPYLEAADVETLMARVDKLSARKSVFLFDVVGRSLLDSPFMKPALEALAKLGSPWKYGTEEPEALIAPRGWDATSTEPAVVGSRWGRWPFPPAPPGVPGVPRGYLVGARKR